MKESSTEAWLDPVFNKVFPESSPLLKPNKAKSIARSIVVFPEPMFPLSRVDPVGKSSSRFSKLLMFFNLIFYSLG